MNSRELKVLSSNTGALEDAVFKIEQRLKVRGRTLAEAIKERGLYFRVSLIGSCNLKCAFCHNEGAPAKGIIDEFSCHLAIQASHRIGFRRIQFTGGEPLLHPRVDSFIREAKKTFDDVGVTTNGTFLLKKIRSLVSAGITRIHVSLQAESLRVGSHWEAPYWLRQILSICSELGIQLRLNLPVPEDEIEQAREFLCETASYGCDIQVFSILPQHSQVSYPIEQLRSMVEDENQRRQVESLRGYISLRGYRPPAGIRCDTCTSFNLCREQSHSLRLGADLRLRPCLATRDWDIPLTTDNVIPALTKAALLALDYTWEIDATQSQTFSHHSLPPATEGV